MSYSSLYLLFQKMPYFTAILRTQLPVIISNKNFDRTFIFNFKSLPPQLLTFLYMPILLQPIKPSCFVLKLDDGIIFYYVIISFLVCFFFPLGFFSLAMSSYFLSISLHKYLLQLVQTFFSPFGIFLFE